MFTRPDSEVARVDVPQLAICDDAMPPEAYLGMHLLVRMIVDEAYVRWQFGKIVGTPAACLPVMIDVDDG